MTENEYGYVELIALGYEFRCKVCFSLNNVMEITSIVTCKKCGTIMPVTDTNTRE